ncbi:uncharacterized protein STEHIDRAFT_168090 [Stereum hirsutum FP-91666 SS1]|uniref:uncharacterized protein n=1 Tax=Stereum hirsutum (strain FP-91666) TaxID=721885 RepID=UPI000440C3AC|nr:uncharacterized protein STEHIDRAFT_168090 [Stereum hirsutum FP-91666 SS1]EIM87288.1 hypothetical protein STEHIDRAFT_168090 [Stereum hirsutum FP-91666 SS1]
MAPQDDPRDPALETKLVPPPTWAQESLDGAGTAGMMLAAAGVMTRNRTLAWPALLFGIGAYINAHPIRTKEGSNPPIVNLLMSFFALVASYLPLFLQSPSKTATQTPL